MESEQVKINITPDNNVELESVKVVIETIQAYKQKFLYSNQMTPDAFDAFMTQLFPTFKENYPTLYKMTLVQKDMTLANYMVDRMIDINNNNANMEDVRKDLGEHLAQTYVYPKVGKPDKKK